MKKIFIITFLILGIIILKSCKSERRLDFCECYDIKSALTDSLLLSKSELRDKQEGCNWIEEELSPLEIQQKFIECIKINKTTNTTLESTSVQTPSDEGKFVHIPNFSCRQCSKQIDWYGSYYWVSYLDESGNVNNVINFLEDNSLYGDDRINTELYSEERAYTRGIFCSEDCARININNWSYPEE